MLKDTLNSHASVLSRLSRGRLPLKEVHKGGYFQRVSEWQTRDCCCSVFTGVSVGILGM